MAEPQSGGPVEYILSNGMTYIRNYTPDAELTQVQIIVRAGSRDEPPEKAGFAHALEHYFFKGGGDYPDGYAIEDTIATLGGEINAFTSIEMASFFGNGLKEDVLTLAKVITAMVTRPRFPREEWPHERQRVLEEAANAAANPNQILFATLLASVFGGAQPLSWSTIGSIPLIERSEPEDLIDYFENNYDPSKMAIVISGGATLEPEEVDKLVAAMPHGHNPPRVPAQWGIGDLFVGTPVESAPDQQQVQFWMALPGVPFGVDAVSETNEIAMDLLSTILGGGDSSRLAGIARRDPATASALSAWTFSFEDTGLFLLTGTTTPGGQERSAHIMIDELRKLAATPATFAEVVRAQEGVIAQLYAGTEEVPNLASYYAQRWAHKKDLLTPDELAARIRAVDAPAVQRAAQQLVAHLNDLRFSFLHPSDPVTGRNNRGQTVKEAGRAIRDAALEAPTADLGLEIA